MALSPVKRPEDRLLILPIWHQVRRDDVLEFFTPLYDLIAASSDSGLDHVVETLLKKIRPAESPLIVARDFLIKYGATPPVITDEWWIDVVELKEAEFLYPNLNHEWRWTTSFHERFSWQRTGTKHNPDCSSARLG
ncbi:MAG: hypothetical protein R3C69_02690 [Geminicoccaceae bacterium]